jgi:hypothetical protein
MKLFLSTLLSFSSLTLSAAALENSTCQKCHPKIFKEYQNSMHQHASIYNDPIHKAIWDLHPAKKKGNYKCAKCHTPADHELIAGKTTLEKNPIQIKEPISCLSCHQIEDIEEHAKANKNIYTKDKKTFFTADREKKGTKLLYHDKSSFFGLFKTRVGSPYHDIDYTNEKFYNGDICMGCHAHKQNGKGFTICDLEVKEDSHFKENCISCHMPKIPGSYVNLKDSKKHAFHGVSALTLKPHLLSKYVKLSLEKEQEGFTLFIKNMANHTLTPHPLRVSKLKVTIERDGEKIVLKERVFQKVIGTQGKPSMPWLATEVLKDTLIKAFEKRPLHYQERLQKGDEVVVEFGYYLVNPKLQEKLKVEDDKYKKFIVLTKKRFIINN